MTSPSPEWALRYEGEKRVLMRRTYNIVGAPPDWMPWEDVATFDDRLMADEVFGLLQRGYGYDVE